MLMLLEFLRIKSLVTASEISSTDGTYATDCMYCTRVSVLVGLVGVSVSHMTWFTWSSSLYNYITVIMVPLSITAIDDDRRTGTRARSKVVKLPSHANYIIDYAFALIMSEKGCFLSIKFLIMKLSKSCIQIAQSFRRCTLSSWWGNCVYNYVYSETCLSDHLHVATTSLRRPQRKVPNAPRANSSTVTTYLMWTMTACTDNQLETSVQNHLAEYDRWAWQFGGSAILFALIIVNSIQARL